MSEMKYRFKSPEELRNEQQSNYQGLRKRNRITLLVLLDIAILAIVMAVVYFSGILDGPQLNDPADLIQATRILGASHKISDHSCIFYLHVQNSSKEAILFPETTDLPLRCTIKDHNGSSLYANLDFTPENIEPGETRILRGEIPCPAERLPLNSAHISLGEDNNKILLNFTIPAE